jgi:methylated-DNA-protein-cysteine methyltransferase-like protein
MADSVETARQVVWQIVNSVPNGKVATYGQIARLAGMPAKSRLVGKILSQLPPGTKLPWHRVINSAGKITNPNSETQIERLKDEGITPVNGKVSLRVYQWQP